MVLVVQADAVVTARDLKVLTEKFIVGTVTISGLAVIRQNEA